jgi:hypothetical protein
MGLKEEFTFLYNLGLNMILFSKDFKKCYRRPGDCNFFIIITRLDRDKLYYRNIIPEEDLSKLKNWIRYGDPTGLTTK